MGIFDNPTVIPRRPRYIPKNIKHEEGVQKRVASYLRKHYPHVDFHSDYAAGVQLTKSQAGIRKSLQSGRGWPDMFIAWPAEVLSKDGTTKRHCCGLFLELKKEGTTIYVTRGPRKGRLSLDEQIQLEAAVLNRLNNCGYYAVFAVGYDDAVSKIEHYMGGDSVSLF